MIGSMNVIAREIVLFFILLIGTSCSSTYRFLIDVQEPAAVTLPVSAQNVLILNNTIIQPEDYGIERTFNGQSVSNDYPLLLDSMVWLAIGKITNVLNESGFFNTVAVYRELLRTDAEWFSIANLSTEDQADFYNMGNFDALLVVDRLLFSIKEDVKTVKTGAFSFEPLAFLDLKIDGIINCSMYTYGKEKPLISFSVSDSLSTKFTIDNDSILLFKEIPEFLLEELSRRIGNLSAQRFIPTWKTEERTLFTGYGARMQEAAGYAANLQWAKAESIWTIELENKTKLVDKAKIAFNLAVANEMQDKIEQAFTWALKAKEHLKNVNPDNENQTVEITNKYISKLEQRIQNNRLLDLQWGRER